MPDFFTGFLGVPVDAAYHAVSAFVHVLTPLPGGLAAPAAIVLFTLAFRLLVLPLSYRAMRGMDAQARIAPQVQALRRRHAGHPDRLQRELTALYQAEGTGMLAGCLPMLLQWPLVSVVYLLFRSPKVGGSVNTLLSHDLFGAPLGSHWLGGAGPLSTQGAVFAGLFVLLAVVGWLSARTARRLTSAAASAATSAAAPAATPAVTPAAKSTTTPAAEPTAAAGMLTRMIPYATVVAAAFVPLAAGLYLITTTAWTLAERTLLRRPKPGGLPVAPGHGPATGRKHRPEIRLPRSLGRGYRRS
jgi:YidC/Oxa1 family membrane protein insertase